MSAEKKIVNQGSPHRQTDRQRGFLCHAVLHAHRRPLLIPKQVLHQSVWHKAMQGEEFPTQTSKGVLLNSPLRQFLVRTQKAVSLWGIRFLQSCSAFDMRSCSYPVILLKRFPDFSHRLSCNESLSVVAECDSPKFEETAAAVKLMQATEQNWSGSCGTVFYNHKGKKSLFFFYIYQLFWRHILTKVPAYWLGRTRTGNILSDLCSLLLAWIMAFEFALFSCFSSPSPSPALLKDFVFYKSVSLALES